MAMQLVGVIWFLLALCSTFRSSFGIKKNNWNDAFSCYTGAIAKPRTIEEVQDLVKNHSHVRVNGPMHSFNDFACSPELMLSTKHLNQVVKLDTENMTVTVQGGMLLRNLLKYLSDRGYTFTTFPYYIDQSIGGAISTYTHGASTSAGTLSSLLRSVKLVLADGSVRVVEADKEPELMKAVSVSMGLLGIIVEVELPIIKEEIVKMVVDIIRELQFFDDMRSAIANPLTADEVNYFWFPALKMMVKSTIQRGFYLKTSRTPVRTFFEFVYYILEKLPKLQAWFYRTLGGLFVGPDPVLAAYSLLFFQIYVNTVPGRYPFSRALPTQAEVTTAGLNKTLSTFNASAYVQYEFALTFDRMEACLEALFKLIDTKNFRANFTQDFRLPPNLRFVAEGNSYLATTNGGPRLFLNFDNYFESRSGKPSTWFEEIKALMSSDICQGRPHLGKAGFFSFLLNGSWTYDDALYFKRSYLSTWRNFTEYANLLDPHGKFADARHLLRT